MISSVLAVGALVLVVFLLNALLVSRASQTINQPQTTTSHLLEQEGFEIRYLASKNGKTEERRLRTGRTGAAVEENSSSVLNFSLDSILAYLPSPDNQLAAINVLGAEFRSVQIVALNGTLHKVIGRQPCTLIGWTSKDEVVILGQTDTDFGTFRVKIKEDQYVKLNVPNNAYEAAISPDGSKLAYFSTSSPLGGGELWIMNLDGSAKKRLFVEKQLRLRTLEWAPNSRAVAFIRIKDNPDTGFTPTGEIWTLSLTDNSAKQLSLGGAHDAAPIWSPDSTALAYLAVDNPNDAIFLNSPRGMISNLWVINTSDLMRKQLTSLSGKRVCCPSWSPDGVRLAFVSGDQQYDTIWVTNLETNEVRQLKDLGGVVGFVEWVKK